MMRTSAGALNSTRVLIADQSVFNRSMIADILRAAGFNTMLFAQDGEQLLQQTIEHGPKIVIAGSRLPLGQASGLEFTRLVRAGHRQINRALPIIITTSSANLSFVDIARSAGVDEILARPFTAKALLARVEAVRLRPRQFVDSATYVGPDRRRRMLQEVEAPRRRLSDPVEDPAQPLWESSVNRDLMRACVARIAARAGEAEPGDRASIQSLFAAVEQTWQLASEFADDCMEAAARSLIRYITAFGAAKGLEADVVSTHIDAMQKLGVIGSCNRAERTYLVSGLQAAVDKRLGRGPATPLAAA